MPSLTLADRLIWFAHCPKAVGTSIEQAMVATWGDRVGHLAWGWQRRRRRDRSGAGRTSPQHIVWADALRVLPRPPDAVFALVRDPVARMTSEQRWQRHGRTATVLGRALAWLPFPLWLRLMLALAARDPQAFDNHLRPQSDFVPEDAAVFRLEEGMTAPARWLAEATGQATPEIAHALRSAREAPAVTAACRARIAAAHARDMTRFGYGAPSTEVLPADALDRLARRLAPALAALDRHGWF